MLAALGLTAPRWTCWAIAPRNGGGGAACGASSLLAVAAAAVALPDGNHRRHRGRPTGMRARGVLSTSLFALVLGVAGCTGMPPAATPPTTATPAPDGAQTTPAATSPTIAPPRAPETVAPSGYRQGAGATDPQGWATFEARAQLVASGLAPGIELPGDSAIPGTILKVLPARATSLVDASHVMFEVAYDPCQTRVAAWVWEDATSVVVGGTASTPSPKPAGRCLAVAGALKANLPLAAPIGGRPVLTTTGEVLVRGKVSSSSTVR